MPLATSVIAMSEKPKRATAGLENITKGMSRICFAAVITGRESRMDFELFTTSWRTPCSQGIGSC